MKITINELTKIFPNRKKGGADVVAVNKMSIDIPSGKLVGLLGPSGCGKSTTLFMLSGLEQPSGGKIYFDDLDVTDLAPEKRGIGLVFQNYALYPHMTVEQNIMFPLENMRIEKSVCKERALDAARLVQIEDLLARKPSELSGGQQQRVAIARALVKMPNVLLLDEPLSNLDARLRLQTREEIKRIQRETGITTVFVTHDQEEAMSICDIMVVMKLGVVQQIGKPQDIYDNPANLFVANFLGTPPINILKGVIKDGKVYVGEEAIADAKDYTEFYQEKLAEAKERLAEVQVKHAEEYEKYIVKVNGLEGKKLAAAEAKYGPAYKKVVNELENLEARIAKLEDSLANKKFAIYVGIRPEGFIYDPKGVLTLDIENIEVMGRDKSVVSKHVCSTKPNIRSIIDAEVKLPDDANQFKFNLKKTKVFLFDEDTEERLR